MRDPYSVLGVSRSADEKEIKSAFRKLAKQYHPDQNQDNPRAKEQFALVNAAYEIVGDKEKRRKFDAGEIDAEGKETFQGFSGGDPFGRGGNPFGGPQSGGFSGAEDILSRMFGGGFGGGDPFAGMNNGSPHARRGPQPKPPKGADRKINLSVSLEDLAKGKAAVRLGADRSVNVTIPPEAETGQTIRLRGQGENGPGGKGDVLITLSIAPHALFLREDSNLRVHVPVALADAVLGGKIRVPTLDKPVALTIPEWTTSGKVFRVRGRGLPKRDGNRGDILAVVAIDLGESPDPDLIAILKNQVHAD